MVRVCPVKKRLEIHNKIGTKSPNSNLGMGQSAVTNDQLFCLRTRELSIHLDNIKSFIHLVKSFFDTLTDYSVKI